MKPLSSGYFYLGFFHLSLKINQYMSIGYVRLCFQSVDNRIMSSKSLVACIVPTTRTSLPKRMHVWELFNEYYGMKVSDHWSVV